MDLPMTLILGNAWPEERARLINYNTRFGFFVGISTSLFKG
jgi:hypothetical protein